MDRLTRTGVSVGVPMSPCHARIEGNGVALWDWTAIVGGSNKHEARAGAGFFLTLRILQPMKMSTRSTESAEVAIKLIACVSSLMVVGLLIMHVASKAEYEKRMSAIMVEKTELTQQLAAQHVELEEARANLGEIKRLRRENEEIHQLRASSGSLEKLQADNRKLLGEVELLRSRVAQSQVLTAQFQQREKEYAQLIRQAKIDQVANQGSAEKRTCIAHLKQMDGAKQQWAIDNKKSAASVPTPQELFGPTQYIKNVPTCPSGGRYTLNSVGQNPTCSHPDHKL